jgi:hypothetical protein
MGANHTNFKFSLLIDTNYYKFAIWVFPDGSAKKVMFMWKAAFDSRCKAIDSAIIG